MKNYNIKVTLKLYKENDEEKMSVNTTLLSEREQQICKKMSSQRTLEGKRTKALLALNDGDTQVIAAKKSGLTYGQVKYLLTVFRKKGMALFPAATIKNKEEVPAKKEKPKISKTGKKASKKSVKKKDKKKRVKKTKEKSKSEKAKSKASKKKKNKKTKKSKKKK